jgi:2-polyprenyl-3-methyl-5-hydroxy-6-metoxy-1,4-benzoquinol methylase
MDEQFPGNYWDDLYKYQPVELMPWYRKTIDHDLAREIKERNLSQGTFLDLGTGPGTQAAGILRLGFTVTATDISQSAIDNAKETYKGIEFIRDDITDSKLVRKFDYIFDRGCFHVLPHESRSVYALKVHELLGEGGMLFLKCFSIKEPGNAGPARLSADDIQRNFKGKFHIESIIDTEFRGVRRPNPKALFCILRKISIQ